LASRSAVRSADALAWIFSSVTAALLQRPPEVPWAVRFDSTAALNRPGSSGAWQRALERRLLRRATLLLPWGEQAGPGAVVRGPGGAGAGVREGVGTGGRRGRSAGGVGGGGWAGDGAVGRAVRGAAAGAGAGAGARVGRSCRGAACRARPGRSRGLRDAGARVA